MGTKKEIYVCSKCGKIESIKEGLIHICETKTKKDLKKDDNVTLTIPKTDIRVNGC
jgi:hypothetical protein